MTDQAAGMPAQHGFDPTADPITAQSAPTESTPRRGDMTPMEHIAEFRSRLIKALIAIGVGAVLGFMWYSTKVGFIPPLGEILRGPYCSLPADLRADLSGDGECRLLATKPFDMFLLRFKVGLVAGMVISSPFWLFQIWAFIAPGLYKKEKRATALFLSVAVFLFVLGALLAYFVLDKGLQFLLGVGREFQVAAITGTDYYTLIRNLVLVFGVSFEAPLIVVALNHLGILTYETISGKRRLIWMLVFIFGAVLSPGQEVISMMVLALSVGILLELSFLYCRFNDKRRAKETEAALAL